MVRVQLLPQHLSDANGRKTGNLFPARLRTTHIEKHQNMTYRRNGKLQACEPCRKGKLRCDHMMPTCGRCVKRGKTDKCTYHPAPLTKSGTSPAHRVASPDQASCNIEGKEFSYQPHPKSKSLPKSVAYLKHLADTDRPRTFQSFPRSVQSERDSTTSTSTSFTQSPSFQSRSRQTSLSKLEQAVRTDAQGLEDGAAFISHSAVIAENELSIGLSPPDSTGEHRVSQSHIERGVAVLALLKDLPSIQTYIDKWFSFAGGVVIIEPMVKIYLDGLWSTWHKILESSKHADLQAMSAQIWKNTSKPVSRMLKRDTTPREFCSSVTGPDMRWEVIGILVSLVSLVAQSLKGVLPHCDQMMKDS